MNVYMKNYIQATINYLKTFETSLKAASFQDDGKLDKQEQKLYNKVTKLTDKYMDQLEELID